MSTQPLRRPFTVQDYARMHTSGILAEDDRVELLNGEILLMSPVGAFHVAIVNRLNRLLTRLSADDAIVSVQNPIQLDDYSEPQPDIALLTPRDDDYDKALPHPEDILLLIEVADSSLGYDRNQKLPRYAAASIVEVWIIDVEQRHIEQHTQPMQGHYTHLTTVLPGAHIQATRLPNVQFTTDRLFV